MVVQTRRSRASTRRRNVIPTRCLRCSRWVGIILQVEGDVDGARDRFERVLRIDPEATVAANNLAWIYAEHGGNLDVALHLAQTAQKRLPGVAQVNHTLGFIYYKKDLVSLAIRTFKLSAENDPGNPRHQFHLGLAYAKAGETTSARQSLIRALAVKPDFDGAQEASVPSQWFVT